MSKTVYIWLENMWWHHYQQSMNILLFLAPWITEFSLWFSEQSAPDANRWSGNLTRRTSNLPNVSINDMRSIGAGEYQRSRQCLQHWHTKTNQLMVDRWNTHLQMQRHGGGVSKLMTPCESSQHIWARAVCLYGLVLDEVNQSEHDR